ncbi:hypothetical protein [Ciceribacter sp. L1K22]|uniref:hypothetical protein n=1 Tax=Ciceribacter sp. L1K22 TaxID=2820275 RepID=UPI001ABDEBD2|nr:hypothetical protein [Ciceribacter sp. L1K22]MBO3760352.1 hypothetical protein [Ciceribacter sp. L1K22]
MNIGIGLGGFMDGFTRGMDAREAMDQRKRRKMLDARADAEYQRSEDERKAISEIGIGAQREFDSRVAAGTAQPNDFDTFWADYALPKMRQTYLANGDIESARKVMEWGEAAETKLGAKLSMNAIFKAQNGDVQGALTDAVEVGKLRGYLDHSYDIKGFDTIHETEGGPVVGYRLNMSDPDGKPITQDFRAADVPNLLATYLNPEAAWQTQIAARESAAKEAGELRKYEEKKKIDQAYGTKSKSNDGKVRSTAVTNLRKRMDGGLGGEEPTFDDLPREKQEELIEKEIELLTGQPGTGQTSQRTGSTTAPASNDRKVVVDRATGKPVEPPAERAAPERRAPTRRDTPPPREAPPRDPRAAREQAVTSAVGEAETLLQQGVPPQRVAEILLQNNVSQNLWPPALRQALQQAQAPQGAVGIMRGGPR